MHVGKLDKVADVMVRLGERIDSYSKRMGGSATVKNVIKKDMRTPEEIEKHHEGERKLFEEKSEK